MTEMAAMHNICFIPVFLLLHSWASLFYDLLTFAVFLQTVVV